MPEEETGRKKEPGANDDADMDMPPTGQEADPSDDLPEDQAAMEPELGSNG